MNLMFPNCFTYCESVCSGNVVQSSMEVRLRSPGVATHWVRGSGMDAGDFAAVLAWARETSGAEEADSEPEEGNPYADFP